MCKFMFLSTLGYTNDEVIIAALKNTDNEDFVTTDQKGKHAPPHKMSETEDMFMKLYIKGFNPWRTHYRYKHAPQSFLSSP